MVRYIVKHMGNFTFTLLYQLPTSLASISIKCDIQTDISNRLLYSKDISYLELHICISHPDIFIPTGQNIWLKKQERGKAATLHSTSSASGEKWWKCQED